MSYLLYGVAIRPPTSMQELNSTQSAQQRALNGSIGRDYFGSNKRVWVLKYTNVNTNDYNTLKLLYAIHIGTNTALSWEVNEGVYATGATTVYVDLQDRNFTVKGDSYLSEFTMTLTEA